jgi:hypothetical protein
VLEAIQENMVFINREKKFCRLSGLNRRPSDLQSDALPTELSRLHMREVPCGNKESVSNSTRCIKILATFRRFAPRLENLQSLGHTDLKSLFIRVDYRDYPC